jgi:hypothetical protein
MHKYIKADCNTEKIYLYLAIISIILSALIGIYIKKNEAYNAITFLTLILSGFPFTIYGLLYWLFDRWLWKIFAKWINVVNLNGEYEGIFKTSYDNFQNGRKFNLKIEQTFSKILIKFSTNSSTSESLIAYLKISGKDKVELVYNYQNTPKERENPTLTEHKGTTWLIFDLSTMEFKGFYYTDKRPTNEISAKCNYGQMEGKKISTKHFRN